MTEGTRPIPKHKEIKNMASPLTRITKFARTLELSISRGKSPVNKLFLIDRCNYSDILEVKLPSIVDEIIAEQDIIYLLKVEVMVLAGKSDYIKQWHWEPKEYDGGLVVFYHYDHDKLLEGAAIWLEERADPIAPLYKYKRFTETTIIPLKCEPIGRIKHYTTTEGFEEGNLERHW